MLGDDFPNVFWLFFFSLYFREKYLNTLLQVEVMLKLWFPHISAQPVSSSSSFSTSPTHSLQDTSSSTPPHKHRDQLHIPVKVKMRAFHQSACANKPLPLQRPRRWELIFICLLSCSFSRSADSAGQTLTPPRPPLYLSSAVVPVERRGGRSTLKMKGISLLLLHCWLLTQTRVCQMWSAAAS